MTNGHYGKESVKTIELRNSIVKYLMNIHGIVDKYFSYDKINKVLHRDQKAYTKKMISDPESIKIDDLLVTKQLLPEELCHIAIIVMETKKRIELIYVTQALSKLLGL